MTTQWRKSLLLVLACVPTASLAMAFQQPQATFLFCSSKAPPTLSVRTQKARRQRLPVTRATIGTDVPPTTQKTVPGEQCYYRRVDGPWRPRKELRRLSIGERLFATRLPERDLLDGKTGPKVFLECGVGRRSPAGEWSLVNGMARLGRSGMKKSVVLKKKIKRMPADTLIEVYVSRIDLAEGRLEVSLNKEEAPAEKKIPASSLKIGTELTGVVTGVKPYGVFVDVNANRNGLLHIKKVVRRHNAHVDREEGLKKAGLDRGASVQVVVVSNARKRLELDLAPPAVEEGPADAAGAAEESDAAAEEALAWAAYGAEDAGADEEAAMWAAYAAGDGDGGGDDYDEDTDIEDALGIGSY